MLKEEEIFDVARALYANFRKSGVSDALSKAYRFNSFCEAISSLYVLGCGKFISSETWINFDDEFYEQWNEVISFIEDNDWD